MYLNPDQHHLYALDRQQRLRDEAAAHRSVPRRTRLRPLQPHHKEHTMNLKRNDWRRLAQRLLVGAVLAAAVSLAASAPARRRRPRPSAAAS